MSLQNIVISALLRIAQGASAKLSAEHRFRRNRRFLATDRSKPGPAVRIKPAQLAGLPVEWVTPSSLAQPDAAPICLYLHGGAFVMGGLNSHRDLAAQLAQRAQIRLLMVDYRLAPEHPFPAALVDSIQATRWAHANAAELGCDANRIAVGGDSAGANLAAVVAQIAPIPLCHQMLIYPVTDCRRVSASYSENATGYFLTAAAMEWFVDHYLSGGQGSPEDPRVSPLLADDATLRATPPALVITAEFDPLRDEGEQYATRLADLGVATTHVRFSGMIHAFFSMPEMIDDAKVAHAVAAEALKTAFSK
jgi:acetyl esterase